MENFKNLEKQILMNRAIKSCAEFEKRLVHPYLVGKDFQIKENYTDISGNHPKEGKGMKAKDVVFEKSELVEGKLLINENLKQQAKEHMVFLKKNDVRFFVF